MGNKYSFNKNRFYGRDYTHNELKRLLNISSNNKRIPYEYLLSNISRKKNIKVPELNNGTTSYFETNFPYLNLELSKLNQRGNCYDVEELRDILSKLNINNKGNKRELLERTLNYGFNIDINNIKTYLREDFDNNQKTKKKRNNIPVSKRHKVWEITSNGYNGKCYCCHDFINFNNFEAGHVVPYSEFNKDSLDNLVPLCKKCNRNMSNCHLYEWMAEKNLPGIHKIDKNNYYVMMGLKRREGFKFLSELFISGRISKTERNKWESKISCCNKNRLENLNKLFEYYSDNKN